MPGKIQLRFRARAVQSSGDDADSGPQNNKPLKRRRVMIDAD
jgi:hypothetical protein